MAGRAPSGTRIAKGGNARRVFDFEVETIPMLVPDPAAALWCLDAIQCVLVPDGSAILVELRNAAGAAFLRKFTPTMQAALNEAEFLRLLIGSEDRRVCPGVLKPFAVVIEERRHECDALIHALKLSGMRTFGCRSGAEGVCVARELTPDLIVLGTAADVPAIDVCRLVREDPLTASIPLIVLTVDPRAVRAQGCQADAVLTTPCPPETMAAAARLFVRHLGPEYLIPNP